MPSENPGTPKWAPTAPSLVTPMTFGNVGKTAPKTMSTFFEVNNCKKVLENAKRYYAESVQESISTQRLNNNNNNNNNDDDDDDDDDLYSV